jgi:FAD/FMN-containing dehydrogenase
MARPPSRRAFLEVFAGAAAAGAIVPSAATAQGAAIEELARTFAAKSYGAVIRPGMRGHANSRYWNARFDCNNGTTFVEPRTREAVLAFVQWANAEGRTFAVRGGGHSFEGRSSHPDLVIDMAQLDRHSLEPDGTLKAEAGVLLGPVYDTLAAAKRIMPAGTCPTVGLAGHALGGGIGDFLPMFGYAAQAMKSVTLVTMGGSLVRIDDRAIVHLGGAQLPAGLPDARSLMTVLRGGGQGIGIVTDLEFETHDLASTTLATFRVESGERLSREMALRVIQTWQDWRQRQSPALARAVSSKLNFSRSERAYSIEIAGLMALPAGSGLTIAGVQRSLEPLLRMPYWEKKSVSRRLSVAAAFQSFLDDDDTTKNPRRRAMYGSSAMLPAAMPGPAIAYFLNAVPPGVFVSFYTSGGATKSAADVSIAPSEFLVEWVAWTDRPDLGLYRKMRAVNFEMARRAGAPPFGLANYCDFDDREYFPNKTDIAALRARFDPKNLCTSSLLAPKQTAEGRCG